MAIIMADGLIDEFLPVFQFNERHRTVVQAGLDEVYAAVLDLDISEAKISKLLFRLRGLPAGSRITIEDFLKMGFVRLAERPNEEFLLGLVGQFWKPSGKLQRLEADGFKAFDESGFAKTAWNFKLTRISDNSVLLETETRILCLDEASRRRFRFYWTFIGPFSGLIRRDALAVLKRRAEQGVF